MKYKPYTFENSTATFFSWAPVLSGNPQFVGAIGARRFGKTYGCKKRIIKDYLYKDKKFMWLRDNDKSVENLLQANGGGFWRDIKKEFEGHEFGARGNILTINGHDAGVVQNFMTFYNGKGVAFDDSYRNLILDEAIPEKGQIKRGYRARSFLNMIYTVCDTRKDVRIWLTANALNRGDELLRLFGIKIQGFGIYTNRFGKNARVAIHYCDTTPAFKELQRDSAVGGLIAGSQYSRDLIEGHFDSENGLIYDMKPSNCKLVAILHGEEGAVRCWLAPSDGVIYVENDPNPEKRPEMRFATDITLCDLVVRALPDNLLQAFKNALIRNGVRYQDDFIRNIFLDVVMKK